MHCESKPFKYSPFGKSHKNRIPWNDNSFNFGREKMRQLKIFLWLSLSRGMFHFTENGLSETSLCSSAFCPAGPRWKVLSLDRHRFVRMFEKDQAPQIFQILIIFMIIVIIMLNPDVKFSNCPLCFCKISHFGFVIS